MAHEVDIHVGKRIRKLRWLRDWTQQQLAEAVGIKFQQIQKYETGANRVSASRLWDISKALGAPIEFFFDGLNGAATNDLSEVTANKETTDFFLALKSMPPEQRAALRQMAKSMASNETQLQQIAG
ncbi:helix-turn-helix transcriptional regulator [Phaeobacter italicus]|jgi:transcriptional regulator with XRE-family HTH domain|uniref:helix-turn-helix domain-containing protein n=1 Tax=Phaeobacter italicus TaxID=481446 RepID=UPI002FDDD12E